MRSLNGRCGGIGENELFRRNGERRRIERASIEFDAQQLEFVAVKRQRRSRPAGRIGADRQDRNDARRMAIERNIELDGVDEIIGRPIIGETDRLAGAGAHETFLVRFVTQRG